MQEISRRSRFRSQRPSWAAISWRSAVFLSAVLVAGCQDVYLRRGGSLQSYASLTPSDGLVTRALVRIDPNEIRAARSVRVMPTTFSQQTTFPSMTPQQRALIGNNVDRSLCSELSERFHIAATGQPADLTVQAVVTDIGLTDQLAAGVSKGIMVVPMVTGVPAPIPRLPLGLGSISIEAEARDARGDQKAAMVWARGAEILASAATVSEIGDAYGLASKFGEDFGALLVKGESPFGNLPSFPTLERVNIAMGLSPRQSACERFGRSPGVAGLAATHVGIPPEWTDEGAARAD